MVLYTLTLNRPKSEQTHSHLRGLRLPLFVHTGIVITVLVVCSNSSLIPPLKRIQSQNKLNHTCTSWVCRSLATQAGYCRASWLQS
jgi:hypothetical protein